MRKAIVFLILLLFVLSSRRPLAAADERPVVADGMTDLADPTANFDGRQLLTSFTVWPAYRPSTTVYVQFDVAGNRAINDAMLTLDIVQTHLAPGGNVLLALHAVHDDGWDEATLTAATAPAITDPPLATALVQAADARVSFNSAELRDFLMQARGADGVASLALVAESQSGSYLFGTLLLGDLESGLPAILTISEGVPLAVGLYSVATESSLKLLLLPALLLTLWTLGKMLPAVQRAPQRLRQTPLASGRRRPLATIAYRTRRAGTVLLASTIALSLLLGMWHLGSADSCTPALPVVLRAQTAGDQIILNWDAQPGNSRYLVYAAPNAAALDLSGSDPIAILDGDATGFVHDGALLAADTWVYVVVAQANCDDSSAAGDPFGVRVLPLAGDPAALSLVTPGFAGATHAAQVAEQQPSLDLLLRFDTDSQTFTAFVPPAAGNDFDLRPGVPIFVSQAEAGRSGTLFLDSGTLQPVDFQLQAGLFNPLSIPLQRTDLEDSDSDQLLDELGCADALHIWDDASQQMLLLQNGVATLPLVRFMPFFVLPTQALCPQWPAEQERFIVFAQNRAADQVYVRWFTEQVGVPFNIYRRAQGAPNWQQIAVVSPVANAGAFSAQVPTAVISALGLDLRLPGQQVSLTPQQVFVKLRSDRGQQFLLGNRHHEVAIAFGSAYLDATAPPHVDLEYYVAPVTQTNPFGTPYLRPVCADHEAPALAPLNVRVVNIAGVPNDLGILSTARGTQGAERFDYDLAQSYRQMDGRVHLDWRQMRPQPSGSNPWDCWADSQLAVAGFTVERNGPTTGNTDVIANDQTPGGVVQLAGAGSTAEGRFRFEDALVDLYPQAAPGDLYAPHAYRVCAVNWLGNPMRCDSVAQVAVRELDTPRSAELLTPTLDALHTHVDLTWVYSDTDETSTPVTFYVMRTLRLTAPLAQWQHVATTAATSLRVQKQPGDESLLYWYAVHVRDAAGNWSAISNVQHAAFYPRTAPPFNPTFGNSCVNNTMPITLNAIDPAYRQVALYRAFDAGGPYKLVQRLWIVNGSVTLTERYTPTYTTDIYYRLEALDGHGNVSSQTNFCARRTTPTPAPRPLPGVVTGENGTILFNVTDPQIPGTIEVVVNRPGPGGLQNDTITAAQAGSSVDAGTIDWGAAAELTIARRDPLTGAPGESTTRFVRRTNNFLGTGRHMTDLGPLSVQWDNDVPRLTLTSECNISDCVLPSFERPLVAIYRKAHYGNWMQVSPLIDITSPGNEAWWIVDESNPTPEETYTYAVLAFSPDSLEVLGTWRPATLPPLQPTTTGTVANLFFDPSVQPPDALAAYAGCAYNGVTPATLGFPVNLTLAGGWMYEVDAYFVATGGACPPVNVPNGGNAIANVYASGILRPANAAPALTVQTLFNDFRLDSVSGVATGTLHVDFAVPVGVNSGIVATWDGVAFQDDALVGTRMVAGVYQLALPATVRLLDTVSGELRNAIRAYMADPDPNTSLFPQQPIATALIDENLPWQINGELIEVTPQAILLDQFAFASPRWFGPLPAHPAANNLGYLLTDYLGSGIDVTSLGLSGQFTSTTPIAYATSLPAAFNVVADRAHVLVSNSQISGGHLANAGITFDAYRDRNVVDYLVAGASGQNQTTPFDPPRLHSGARQDPADQRATVTIALSPAGGSDLALDQLGAVVANVTLDSPAAVEWLHYSATSAQALLYLTAVSYPDAPTAALAPTGVTASMPAHSAWQPRPLGAFDQDPGLNLIDTAGELEFGCFTPKLFSGGSDLYVRRGGVSDAFTGDVAGLTVGYGDFQVQFGALELAFQDNYLLIPPSNIAFTLTLPYPSRIVLPVTLKHLAADCRADLTTPPNTTVTHAYWNFQHTVQAAILDPATPDRMTLESRNADVIALTDAQGIAVQPALTTVWYANGDSAGGRLRERTNRFAISGMAYDLTTIILIPYYRTAGDTSSLPFAPTLAVSDTLGGLPATVLDSSDRVTGQSLKTCSAFPATAGATGCGLILFDGNGVVDYFGELETNPTLPPSAGQATQGQSPIVTATADRSKTFAALLQEPLLGWEWATGEQVLNYFMPTRLLSNKEGGVIVGLKHDFKLLPDIDTPILGQITMPEIAVGDLGFVVSFKQPATGSAFDDQIGIYAGYAAAQAAIRALAQAAPDLDETVWTNVEPHAVEWMEKFGYTVDKADAPPADPANNCKTNARKDKDDPVDLACEVWSSWGTKGFAETYAVVNGKVKALKMQVVKDGVTVYGGTSWRLGDTLKDTGVILGANLGDVLFVQKNGEWQLAKINIGTAIEMRQPSGGAPRGNQNSSSSKDDLIMRADWLSFQYNQDGELLLRGEKIQAGLMGGLSDNTISVALLIGTKEGDERIEGGLLLSQVELGEVTLKNVGAVLGAGRYNFKPLIYVGIRGEGKFDSATVGGTILVGTFSPASQSVLEVAGFKKPVAKMKGVKGLPKPFLGVYGNLFGSAPLYKGTGFEIGGYIEIEGYYFEAQPVANWGGTFIGAIYAKSPIISGRGQLELNVEQITKDSKPGAGFLPKDLSSSPIASRTCSAADGCIAFTGQIWIAAGIGACEPETWKSWDAKWWGDNGCYQAGLLGALGYLDAPNTGDPWQLDFRVAFEPLFD